MTFDEYQKAALQTAISHPNEFMNQTVLALGIGGEAGELVDKWKKIIIYKESKLSAEDKKELAAELGDLVWYVAVLAHSLNLSFDDVMKANLEKLAGRKKRGVIRGQGSDR